MPIVVVVLLAVLLVATAAAGGVAASKVESLPSMVPIHVSCVAACVLALALVHVLDKKEMIVDVGRACSNVFSGNPDDTFLLNHALFVLGVVGARLQQQVRRPGDACGLAHWLSRGMAWTA
jgi:hypothetical protein